jgi:hypothetical protein
MTIDKFFGAIPAPSHIFFSKICGCYTWWLVAVMQMLCTAILVICGKQLIALINGINYENYAYMKL